jgi:hypothetical protein
MDGYLHQNLMAVHKIIRRDDDCVIVVDGRERSGKSVLAMQIACALDPTMTLERVTLNGKEFRLHIYQGEKYQCVILDEAMDIFYTKESQSWINKFFNKMLAKIGQKNLITILVLPSFFELDKYPALHRSRILLHVYTYHKQRGYFSFYNYSKKLTLHILGKKFYDYRRIRPNFKGRFTNYYPLDEVEYRKKKADSLVEDNDDDYMNTKYKIQRDWLIQYLNKKKEMSHVDIAEVFKDCDYPINKSAIGNVCKHFKEVNQNGERERVRTRNPESDRRTQTAEGRDSEVEDRLDEYD